MNLVDAIANAIWEGFEADPNAHADREMDVIDTGGHYEVFSMERIAEHVLDAFFMARTINTPGELDTLPVPASDSLNGTLIRALGHPAFGDVYERNTDGTWGLLATPGSDEIDQHRVPSADIPLPALVLWVPGV